MPEVCPKAAATLPLLESAHKRTAPRRVDLYDIFCAILYLLRTGCSCPGNFPKWRTVHSYSQRWIGVRENGTTSLRKL